MRELALRNRQRVRPLDLRQLRRVARALLQDLLGLRGYELGVHLVSAAEIARLNETFLRHAGTTDVITFDHSEAAPSRSAPREGKVNRRDEPLAVDSSRDRPSPAAPRCLKGGSPKDGSFPGRPAWGPAPELQGEIFICLLEAVKQARRFRTTWQSEVVRCLVHGILHLQGYDDLHPRSRRRMRREEDRLLRELAGRFRLSALAREPRLQP